MANSNSKILKEMASQRRLIRFDRRFEESSVRGYVLDVGPKFFLLALVSDRIWFDGFECYRISNVSNVQPDPYAAFVELALRQRGQLMPKKPRIDLQNMKELLLTAGWVFPLITIHREEIDPDVCWIGALRSVVRGRVSLLEINPDASWDAQPNEYPIREITRVSFAGDYEDALYLVGGEPPGA